MSESGRCIPQPPADTWHVYCHLLFSNCQTRVFNLDNVRPIRDLDPIDIDSLVSVKGMITRSGNIIPDLRCGIQVAAVCHQPVPHSSSLHEYCCVPALACVMRSKGLLPPCPAGVARAMYRLYTDKQQLTCKPLLGAAAVFHRLACFRCEGAGCGNEMHDVVERGVIVVPAECRKCKRKATMRMIPNRSGFLNRQVGHATA